MNPIYVIPVGLVIVLSFFGIAIFGFPGGKRQRRASSMNQCTIMGAEIQRSIETFGSFEAIVRYEYIIHESHLHGFEICEIGFANEGHLAKDCADAYEKATSCIKKDDREYQHKGDMIIALERFRVEHCVRVEEPTTA